MALRKKGRKSVSCYEDFKVYLGSGDCAREKSFIAIRMSYYKSIASKTLLFHYLPKLFLVLLIRPLHSVLRYAYLRPQRSHLARFQMSLSR